MRPLLHKVPPVLVGLGVIQKSGFEPEHDLVGSLSCGSVKLPGLCRPDSADGSWTYCGVNWFVVVA